MTIYFSRKKYRVKMPAGSLKLTLYEKRGERYVKIYTEYCGRSLSPGDLYKRGRELADAIETLEAERKEI